jgi:hypothetical protein
MRSLHNQLVSISDITLPPRWPVTHQCQDFIHQQEALLLLDKGGRRATYSTVAAVVPPLVDDAAIDVFINMIMLDLICSHSYRVVMNHFMDFKHVYALVAPILQKDWVLHQHRLDQSRCYPRTKKVAIFMGAKRKNVIVIELVSIHSSTPPPSPPYPLRNFVFFSCVKSSTRICGRALAR